MWKLERMNWFSQQYLLRMYYIFLFEEVHSSFSEIWLGHLYIYSLPFRRINFWPTPINRFARVFFILLLDVLPHSDWYVTRDPTYFYNGSINYFQVFHHERKLFVIFTGLYYSIMRYLFRSTLFSTLLLNVPSNPIHSSAILLKTIQVRRYKNPFSLYD